MKNLRIGLGNVLALALFAGLAMLLITMFANSTSGLATLKPMAKATATPDGQISPLPTPLPTVPPVQIGPPQLLRASGQVGLSSIGGDKFIGIIGNRDVAYTALLDPTTGAERKLVDGILMNPRISDHWLVYEDHISKGSTLSYSRIKVIDLATDTNATLGGEDANQQLPDVSSNMVVWIDWRNRKSSDVDIYGYDLTTGKEFPVVTRPGPNSNPKISGQWVVYVEPVNQSPAIVDLRAHSLETGDDFSIGFIPATLDSWSGTRYRIDGDKVAWTKNEASGQYALHLYDLTLRTDRTLTEPSIWPLAGISLSAKNGVALYNDAGRRILLDWLQPTPTPISVTLPAKTPWGYELYLSADHLIWWVALNRDLIENQVFVARITR